MMIWVVAYKPFGTVSNPAAVTKSTGLSADALLSCQP